MVTLQGKGVSSGVAFGRIVIFQRISAKIEEKSISDVPGEIKRFHEARLAAISQLNALAESMREKIGEDNALLFEIHSMMLDDGDFIDPIVKLIETRRICAEFSVMEAGKRLAQDFADMDDDYMRQRAVDVQDVARRVVNNLSGLQQDLSVGDEPVILAADDFTPSETAQFDRSKVFALVSQGGSSNSHTAIFARTMGIPAIIGLGDTLTVDLGGKLAAVDSSTGHLYIDPDDATRLALQAKQKELAEQKKLLEQFRGKLTFTKTNRRIKLYANIGSVADAEAALLGDAEGVGLFRTEFLYLERDDYPDEDVQFESYRKVVQKMGDRQVVIRTLDIGADKQADYFNLPKEENPAMGMRAIRICLTRPDLFKTQLRAIYRASAYGNVAIMFPMIASVNELLSAKKYAAEARAELARKQIPFKDKTPIGIMVETPASVIISDLLARESDFFSIGTNDLTQYTLAVDRQNDSIAEFGDTHHEAILRMIRMTTDNAHKFGIWCGICGSLGADETLTSEFLEMGLDELSVEPSSILKLRSKIASL